MKHTMKAQWGLNGTGAALEELPERLRSVSELLVGKPVMVLGGRVGTVRAAELDGAGRVIVEMEFQLPVAHG